MSCSDDVVGDDSPIIFDSCEEMELHPLDHRTHKNKWSRDGETTRVRSKDMTRQGVITTVIPWL